MPWRPGGRASSVPVAWAALAAFGLAALGATEIRVYDPLRSRAEAVARAVSQATATRVTAVALPEDVARDADGVLNCSAVGMHQHPGCPIDPAALTGIRWAFDAVYSPLRTEFAAAAEARGAALLPGAALFFWQGVHAFEIFHGTTASEDLIAEARRVVDAEVARRASAGG